MDLGELNGLDITVELRGIGQVDSDRHKFDVVVIYAGLGTDALARLTSLLFSGRERRRKYSMWKQIVLSTFEVACADSSHSTSATTDQ